MTPIKESKKLNFTDLNIKQFIDKDTNTVDKYLLHNHLHGKDIMFMGLKCTFDNVECESGLVQINLIVYINSIQYVISRQFTF
jgi:hypothetical protein